uniref:Alkaline phosphatase n=1 Tax=Timema monikensis TaxID=170555 RepID=A0A7R9HTV9_9NEOP|nr:unnamed protein product [Timema monikensis]
MVQGRIVLAYASLLICRIVTAAVSRTNEVYCESSVLDHAATEAGKILLYSNILTGKKALQKYLPIINKVPTSWNTLARQELEASLKVQLNTGVARNVILFVGDGMGPNTVTATRIYKAQEGGKLAFEDFPHVGLLKTYTADKQVPDSAATATAMFSGVKSNYYTGGVDQTVQLDDCEASLKPEARLKSFVDWAILAGKDTGFVTTTRVTHATPGPLYSHFANRKWECESGMPETAKDCKDIARQLVEDEPGRSIKVIMGGGRQSLNTNLTLGPEDPLDTWSCRREDGLELTRTWQVDKAERGARYALLSNTGDLTRLDASNVDYVLGIFANGHLKYDFERDRSPEGMPSLSQMTSVAIKVLDKNPEGFVLMVEGGMIDQAHHRGYARRALDEASAMSDAVQVAVDWVQASGRVDTLIVTTSDHTHSLAFNGYPTRGSDITGIGGLSKHDGVPFTTLTYSTGDIYAYNYTTDINGTVQRADPSKVNSSSFHYHQQAAILSDEAHHGGGDVAVYATGPMAHLFHSVHEQHYVAHVIAYSARIGPYSATADTVGPSTLGSLVLVLVALGGASFWLS